ncbi:MAG TPA: FAD-dependent thymidylate synthase [Candidatus Aquilonibacter sp.]|nr:FAD-dependent thymidylate synthase [Candidatus Aquilonibacter sp.]
MPQPLTNEVTAMPEPSDKKSADVISIAASGHRSPQRATMAENSAAEKPSVIEQPAEKPLADAPSTEVFAVYGVEPEIQAYAMAKYSRSALSMKESLREINSQKAEKFLNTFYFQYGHRSIADLAHIALAIERLSILAAIELADEPRWDGQERSTRYQDFKKSGYYTPDFGADDQSRKLYRETLDFLFSEYEALSAHMTRYLISITPKPEEMKQEAYERTLKARAFDITRYLLPLATNTSLGEIVNARTLEMQVAHLLSHAHKEVRVLGESLKKAATSSAYNVNVESLRDLVEQIRTVNPELGARAEAELLHEVRVAPTLVKYADPNPYEMETRRELRQAARELMAHEQLAPSKAIVDLLDEEPLEVEIATTLLYEHCHFSYRQIRQAVQVAGERRRREIIDLGLRHRGKYDEMLRGFRAGQQFRFDILMDTGGFRDMHRHRRCIQVMQGFTTQHGYEMLLDLEDAGMRGRFEAAMRRAQSAVETIAKNASPEAEENSQYAIPLAFKKRTLFKMDFAEVVYISELRTTPAGHVSYRNVAYAMYEAVARKFPALAKYFRVHDVTAPVDLLQR